MGQAHRSSETYINDVRLENPVRNGIYRRLSLCDTAFLTCAISSQEQLMFTNLKPITTELACDCKMSDYVCEELIIEIFTRLPVKSLLRFRSVSKSLCCTIGSPGFIRMHTLRSRQKLLIKHKEPYTDSFYTIHSEDQLPMSAGYRHNGIAPIKFPPRYYYIVGSCNGIFCMYDFKISITLWNPSIRRNLDLPDCPRRYCYMGFGFDPIADDYKVVALPNTHKHENVISHVYAMKTNTWCAIASPIPFFTGVTSRACSVNGSLHWLVTRDFTNSHHILTFDLSTYAFGVIELPEPVIYIPHLTTFRGSLAMVYNDSDDIWMWAMKEYNNTASWSLIFKSKANQVKREILDKDLQQTNNGDFFLDMLCTAYWLWNTKIEMRSELVKFSPHSCIVDIKIFVESLQLLDIKGSGSQ